MNCPHCGNPISPTDRFCPNCGANLGIEETIISRAPPPMPQPPPAPPTYPTEPPPEGATGDRNTALIVAVVLILLCCFCLITVLIAYLLLSGDIVDLSSAFSLAL